MGTQIRLMAAICNYIGIFLYGVLDSKQNLAGHMEMNFVPKRYFEKQIVLQILLKSLF